MSGQPDSFGITVTPGWARTAQAPVLDVPIADNTITELASLTFSVDRVAPVVITARTLLDNTGTGPSTPDVLLAFGPEAWIDDTASVAHETNGVMQIAHMQGVKWTIAQNDAQPAQLNTVWIPATTGTWGVSFWVLKTDTIALRAIGATSRSIPSGGQVEGPVTQLSVMYPTAS